MKHNRDYRIVIIGAGAAGLTAAEALSEKGYRSVTVLEKEAHAGGKCRSVKHENRSYELGAGIITANNATVWSLVKKYGVPVKPVTFGESIVLDEEGGKPRKRSFRETAALAYQLLWVYRRLARRYRHITKPGFAHTEPDLCMPFSKWAALHRIPLVLKQFALFITGFGYGYVQDVPAAYVLKYYSWDTVKAFFKKRVYKFPDGIQGLWTSIAQEHTVMYNADITNIERDKSVTITFEVNGAQSKINCDAMIITSPLDEFLSFADASEAEKNLFSKIKYCDYRIYLCHVTGFPKKSGYLPGNFTPSRAGHPVFWYQRYADSDLYAFYVLGDGKISDTTVLKNIEHIITRLGGTLGSIKHIIHWKYFPHVSSRDMQEGYFASLEKMQGRHHTYYAGELLNFSDVEMTAAYAKQLVETYF